MSYQYDTDFAGISSASDGSLLELLDRLLDQGIVIVGDVRLSVAGIDLLFVGLQAVLCSIETAEKHGILRAINIPNETEQTA